MAEKIGGEFVIKARPWQRGRDGDVTRSDGLLGEGSPAHTIGSHIDRDKGADLASATALVLGADGDYFDVTGTTTITSVTSRAAGDQIVLQFDGILTFTHHATNLILHGGSNITTAAGLVIGLRSEGGGNWREIFRLTGPASGVILTGSTNFRLITVTGADAIAEIATVTFAGDVLGLAIAADGTGNKGGIRVTRSGIGSIDELINLREGNTPSLYIHLTHLRFNGNKRRWWIVKSINCCRCWYRRWRITYNFSWRIRRWRNWRWRPNINDCR